MSMRERLRRRRTTGCRHRVRAAPSPDRTRRPSGSPARTSARRQQRRPLAAACAASCWRCCSWPRSPPASGWCSSPRYSPSSDVEVDRHLAARRRPDRRGGRRCRPATPLARLDLDAIRARVEALAAVQARRRLARAGRTPCASTVTERTPSRSIDRRRRGCAASTPTGVLFRALRRPPGRAAAGHATAGTSRSDALAEAGRVDRRAARRIWPRRVDHVEVATVDQISLVLRDGATVLWGSAERVRPEGRGARRAAAPAGPAARRQRAGPADHRDRSGGSGEPVEPAGIALPSAHGPRPSGDKPMRRRTCFLAARPRVAAGRRRRSPTFVDNHEVDITITLYFRVRVPARQVVTSPPTYTRRRPAVRAGRQADSERRPPWQHRRTTWPSSRSSASVAVESTPSTG